MVIEFEIAGFPVAQGALDVRMHAITSLFEGKYPKYALVAPGTAMPLTFH